MLESCSRNKKIYIAVIVEISSINSGCIIIARYDYSRSE
ncbi:MAG: hypothetical protein ACI9FN_001422 [Saprospiraceae bacterium]